MAQQTAEVPNRARGRWWWRAVVLTGLMLSVLAARTCELYVPQFQTFPSQDWLEALPFMDESASAPSAEELARGIVFTVPDLLLVQGPRAHQPQFTLPGVVVRQVGGLRDAAEGEKEMVRLDSPAEKRRARLSVLVFHRERRATAWADLRSTQLDLGRRNSLEPKNFRTSGPELAQRVWIEEPASSEQSSEGHATVVGSRGVVAFEVDARVSREGVGGPRGDALLVSEAETLARQVVSDWLTWLDARR